MKTKLLPVLTLFLSLLCTSFFANAQPEIPATREWTGKGDSHSWTDGNNWSPVICYDTTTGIYSNVFLAPANGEIVEFISAGNISITNCPFIILGNVLYDNGGYNHCSGNGSSSAVSLYSMQVEPFSYVTLDNTIDAGGSVSQSIGTNINTALEIDQGRLTCPGLSGNFAYGSSAALNMNSIKAENSIIEITNPGTGGGFSPSGRTSFINCTITCSSFSPYSNNDFPTEKDEFIGCTINSDRVQFGGKCIAVATNCNFNFSTATSPEFLLNDYTTENSVTLNNINIIVGANVIGQLYISYKQGASVINGNITCNSIDSSFQIVFFNSSNITSFPLQINGNIILQNGSIYIGNQGVLDITGNLEMNGIPDVNLTKDVSIKNQTIFQIGGSTNFVNYNVGSYGPIPGGFPFGIKFSGSSDSHIKWPIGFPADTLLIEKLGCAKVYFDNAPLHVTGKLQVDSGQLVLSHHNGSNYTLIDGGDIIIGNGGSILVQDSADIAIAGNFIDANANNNPATCNGFRNSPNNTVAFYNTEYTPVNRVIGSASNTSVGNVKFINQNSEPFILQNNFATTNFDFGDNGKVILGDYGFVVNGLLNNYDSSRYFITNGKGSLQLKNVGSSPSYFPVSISTSSYTPVTIVNNGTTDDFKVRVQEGLFVNGSSGAMINEKAVNRTWYLEEATAGGSNANVTLQWNAEDELSNFNFNNAYLIHYSNSHWDFGSIVPVLGSNPYQLTRNNITSFSPFAISNENAVLPLTLIDFNAVNQDKFIYLTWKTSQEVNTKEFDIERSENGLNFTKLSCLPAASNSTTEKNYDYTDLQPLQSKNFYRLKMIDVDGHFSYSNTILLQFASTNEKQIKIYPNPAKDVLNLQLANVENNKILYRIINSLGKVLKTSTITTYGGMQNIPINIKFLAKGIYYLSVTNEKTSDNLKFIKD